MAYQVEEGAFPTSYIPTSGSAVTRAVDFCSMPISRFFYNTSEGSLFVVFDIATSEANKGICAINNSASPTDNRVDLRSQGTAFITSDNVDFDGLNVSSFNQYTTNKAAFAFKSGDSALVKNGGTVDTLSSVFTLPSFDILRVGSIDAGTPNLGSGHIKSIQYFPQTHERYQATGADSMTHYLRFTDEAEFLFEFDAYIDDEHGLVEWCRV